MFIVVSSQPEKIGKYLLLFYKNAGPFFPEKENTIWPCNLFISALFRTCWGFSTHCSYKLSLQEKTVQKSRMTIQNAAFTTAPVNTSIGTGVPICSHCHVRFLGLPCWSKRSSPFSGRLHPQPPMLGSLNAWSPWDTPKRSAIVRVSAPQEIRDARG